MSGLKSSNTFVNWMSSIFLAIALAGCATVNTASAPAPKTEENAIGTPAVGGEAEPDKVTPPKSIAVWVPKGSGAFIVDDQRVFHGIGGSVGSSNPILLRASADNRSREELTKILTQFITFVTETYWNKAGGNKSSDVGNLKLLNEAFIAVSHETVAHSHIAGHWQDPKNNEFYALCRLPLADLKNAISDDTRLDKRSKEFFLQNAETLYDQFSLQSRIEAS